MVISPSLVPHEAVRCMTPPLSQIGSLTVCDDLNQCLGALVTGWVRAAQLLPLLIWKKTITLPLHIRFCTCAELIGNDWHAACFVCCAGKVPGALTCRCARRRQGDDWFGDSTPSGGRARQPFIPDRSRRRAVRRRPAFPEIDGMSWLVGRCSCVRAARKIQLL